MVLQRFNKIVLILLGGAFIISTWVSHGKPLYSNVLEEKMFFQRSDTTVQDTLDSIKNGPYAPSRKPVYTPKDRFGDPFSNNLSSSPLLLKDPASLKLDVEIDTGMNYTIYEKIGDLNYRPTSSMSFDEFRQYQDRKLVKEYWKNKSSGLDGESAVSGRNLIPPIYISPIFDRIFGGSYVEIIPRGFVTLDFGGQWQRQFNPASPIRQQRTGGFEFDMQTSMNVVGKIGEKLSVTANFDNNNSFDFQNNLKVEFTGFEEDIIQKLEIGNVSLPLNNTLISGAQNLFGVKAQMQFGKLFVTSVVSTQRGKAESIEINPTNGGQGRGFNLKASDYEENQHFFLGQYFRDRYEEWMASIPSLTPQGAVLNTAVNVTRVEVYVVNRNRNTQTLRNVVGLMDMGEGLQSDIYNDALVRGTGNPVANNQSNNLFNLVTGGTINDDKNEVRADLIGAGFEDGLDFEVLKSARRLEPSEYLLNGNLGYISLLRRIQPDEAVAVAYEYTNQNDNETYRVGELADDYSSRDENRVVFLKLLKPTFIQIDDTDGNRVPTWDLMMKNIYNLNAGQVDKDGFRLNIIYQNNRTGIEEAAITEGVRTRNLQLIQLMGLDRLNPQGDQVSRNDGVLGDGNFDYLEGVTINSRNGLIIFPKLEPFGSNLAKEFEGDPNEEDLLRRYVYTSLYNKTKNDAEQDVTRNKYRIQGQGVSGSNSEILLRGLNVAEGSVRVTAGGTALVEGSDYQVDYNFGKVTILNESILNSGQKINVDYETADLFNFQTRSLLGTRLDYKYGDDINLGATFLYLNERPLITRNNLGNEPVRNIKYGFDVNIQKESRLLTKIIDAFPLLQTKEPSSVNFSAEIAQLIPGSSNKVQGENASYIDDFESTMTPFNLNGWQNWKLASTPRTRDNRFINEGDPLGAGEHRARLAWYQVDNIFYRTGGRNVPELPETGGEIVNHFERAVSPQEIFTGRQLNVVNTNEPILDLAYFPSEPGPYNYADRTNPDRLSGDPRENWAGITNAIRTETDFDKANIEYIEFWLLDPFGENNPSSENYIVRDNLNPGRNDTGGELIFNLGSVSEDLIPDDRHGFENGLSPDGNRENVEETEWGLVPSGEFLIDAFDNAEGARANQDVGFDGLDNDGEVAKFGAAFGPDPSNDDFRYFLGEEFDTETANIITRYKKFNGADNNSPIFSAGSIVQSNSNSPDNEDLNQDNRTTSLESYYEYKINLKPDELEVGRNFIVDQVSKSINGDVVRWYLYRIPIRQPTNRQGNISDFKTIKFLRTYLTGFDKPVVLRFANFRFVGSQWRRFTSTLKEDGFGRIQESEVNNLSLSVVNIEDNGIGNDKQPAYVLPPGIIRDRDNTSTIERQLNEQSLQLCVEDLEDGDARAAFKTVSLDLLNYKRLKMFFHANSTTIAAGNNDQATAFVRLTADDEENFYEIEVPLLISSPSNNAPEAVWPAVNEIDIDLEELILLKNDRQLAGASQFDLYPAGEGKQVGNQRIRVKGKPSLNSLTQIMIGVRNPRANSLRPTDTGDPQSICLWANEMRVTSFSQSSSWATNASLNAKLADFATVSGSVSYTSSGFGGIQSKFADRDLSENTSYNVNATVNLDKMLPERLGLKIPMYVNYGKTIITPKFDPFNPDKRLETSLLTVNAEDREDYKKLAEDRTINRGFNFTNVRKEKVKEDAKSHIYDVENLTFTYAYSERSRSYSNQALNQTIINSGAVGYNYTAQNQPWEPFQEGNAFSSPYLKFIKDFNVNPLPSSLSFSADLNRQFRKTLSRNVIVEEGRLRAEEINPTFSKTFLFRRTYGLRWDLTQSLSLDYLATANANVDEPEGDIDTRVKRDSVLTNLKRLGRMTAFTQNVSANYRLPLDKLPFTDWLSAEARYNVAYNWKAGALTLVDSLDLGNSIQNARDQSLTGKIDMVKLYNKIQFLKDINSPPRRRRSGNSNPRASDPDSTQVTQKEYKGAKNFLRFLMSLRSITATYSLKEGTFLPGFRPDAYLFGLDEAFEAPGIPFLLGSQDPGIQREAANQDWLIRNDNLNAPFTQSRNIDLSVRASLEPFKDMKIQLDANKRKSAQFQEVFKFDELSNDFRPQNPFQSGSYSISIISLKTAFAGSSGENGSPIYDDFEDFRGIIRDRLGDRSGAVYDSSAQDVLIPAFIAAYTGKDPRTSSLSPFPKTPLPNWRMDYAGLGKIPALKDKFSSINITHSYQSNYTVSNYASSAIFDEGLGFDNNIEEYNESLYTLPNSLGEAAPLYNIDQVQITERFSPLIGVNLRTKSKMNIKVEYKTERSLALQISNRQVTDMRSRDISFDIGFTRQNFKLPFKSKGRVITLKNDVEFRMNMTYRNNETVQRRLDDESTITGGTVDFRLGPNINYRVNDKVDVRIYFNRSIVSPKITTSFKRTTTAFGTQLRFSLAQ